MVTASAFAINNSSDRISETSMGSDVRNPSKSSLAVVLSMGRSANIEGCHSICMTWLTSKTE
eukprot:2211559-Pyramimonas_sp.AAC.1